VDKVVESLELIAVGTATGAILLYSYTKNALHSELVKYCIVLGYFLVNILSLLTFLLPVST